MEDHVTQTKHKSVYKEIKEWMISISIAIVISLLIQNFAFAQVKVQQNSMENTIQDGNRLIENKLVYRFSSPAHGDVVIINGSEYDKRLIKRIIGVQGDMIDIRDGKVWVNGEPLDEPYAKGSTYPGNMPVPILVENDKVFVLGDNRESSIDSRKIGLIATTSIEGKAIFRLWPDRKSVV